MKRVITALLAFAVAGGATVAAADVLDRIRGTETIRLGVRETSAPFSYLDEAGEPAGLAVRLCERVARAIAARHEIPDLKIEYQVVDSKSRFTAISDGTVDLHCGPMTATLERREFLDFSIPYFMDGIGAAFRRDGVQQVDALKGQPIGALANTTAVSFAKDVATPVGSDVVPYPSHYDGLKALGEGKIDIYFGDQGLLLYQLSKVKAEDRTIPITVIQDQFSYEPYSLAMKAGERRLRLEVDRALSEVFLNQEIFTEIEDAMGQFQMSDFAAFLYVLVALPE